MKITAIETIHFRHGVTVHFGPIQYLWVRIHTDEELVGLGETIPTSGSREGRDSPVAGARSAGAKSFGNRPAVGRCAAIDILQRLGGCRNEGHQRHRHSALDIAGKVAKAPVYELLGGPSRRSIRTCNTCYDQIDFTTEPVRLARELFDSGIRAMKIWPFDPVAM